MNLFEECCLMEWKEIKLLGTCVGKIVKEPFSTKLGFLFIVSKTLENELHQTSNN